MNLLNLGASVLAFFSNIWMDIWISLNSVVYQLIEWLYEVFEVIANVNLFSRQAFDDITKRLYVVIGIAMLFIFAYNIILLIINPEDKKRIGDTTKIVKETIIALVLVILLPTIFNYMAVFQKNLLDSHIIEKIIMGDSAGTTAKCDFSDLELIDSYVNISGTPTAEMKKKCDYYYSDKLNDSQRGAYLVAPTLFTAFFHPSNYGYDECVNYLRECKGKGTSCDSSDGKIKTNDDKELCAYYVYDTNIAQFTGGIMNFVTDNKIYASAWSNKGIFDFNYIMALVAGGLAVWMFICYGMAIGVRVAKLGFLQIISPIPVMLRIIPKQKEAIYDTWYKQLLNTYLDVFIRLAIIYFSMFAISLVPDVMKSLFSSFTGNIGTKALAAVVVILGILKFAQEAPELLKQFFKNTGNFALKSPAKQFNENKLAKGAVGMVGGAALGLASGIAQKNAGKAIGGIFRGANNGARNMSSTDLTKKGAFTDSLAKSKYQTDYDQNHSKFKAIKKGIKTSEGFGNYIKDEARDKYENFVDFLKDSNNQSEKYAAANKLFSDSASFNDVVINGIVKDESVQKEQWGKNESVSLGDDWYRRDDTKGVWIGKDKDGNEIEFTKSQMKKKMDDYFTETKAAAMAERLNKSDDTALRESFKRWSSDFTKTLREELPKLGDEVGKGFFKTVNENGGLEVDVNSIDELINKMDELQKKGLAGDKEAFEAFAKTKVAMDKGFKDIKDGQYQDMHKKSDK